METRQELSQDDRVVLAAISDYWEANGISPTLKEISGMVGMRSMGKVHMEVGRLAQMGYIRRIPNSARSLVLLEKA